MSRRRGEFEHRTSIFEGAFRAWSHLGGLEPHDLETKAASELDPLTNPLLENDPRLVAASAGKKNNSNSNSNKKEEKEADDNTEDAEEEKSKEDNDNSTGNQSDDYRGAGTITGTGEFSSSSRREYPYEPLPRSGLSHPFVQAILSPWLGPDADQDAIQLGLTTLRTWWQHRRKGESGSAITALGTERMRGVVEGYTRHFFNLAHCLVTNDGEQPPRTLHTKMRNLEKTRAKNGSFKTNKPKAARQTDSVASNANVDRDKADSSQLDSNLTPLERLHAAQRRQLEQNGGVASSYKIAVKGKCNPVKPADLAGIVDQVALKAQQITHQGSAAGKILSSSNISNNNLDSSAAYGDPNKTPVVFVSENGDIQIAMDIEGITCAHCVKIVETVLRGCNGNKSPIKGLLDAAADRALHAVLIKIDQSSNAKRIAHESARNLAMVGYTAKPKEMKIVDMYTPGSRGNPARKVELSMLTTAFEVVASVDRTEVFNWDNPCSCPDNGVLREDCARHSQMNKRIFEAFDLREQQVSEFMAGCGKNIDLMNSSPHVSSSNMNGSKISHDTAAAAANQQGAVQSAYNAQQLMPHQNQHDTNMQNVTSNASVDHHSIDSDSFGNMTFSSNPTSSNNNSNSIRAGRNNSFTSFGSGRYGRNMSITSETTFGRAMSGLSALSIDWENMEDFDVNVDHSAHINNGPMNSPGNNRSQQRRDDNNDHVGVLEHGDVGAMQQPTHHPPHHTGGATRRRSSLKKNIPFDPNASNMQVSFQL